MEKSPLIDQSVPPDVADAIFTAVRTGYAQGKLPLFVLGAGISAGRVPFLHQMAERLLFLLENHRIADDNLRRELIRLGSLITSNRAKRSDAAEFFSGLQSPPTHDGVSQIWDIFCKELVQDGISLPGGSRFAGFLSLNDDSTSQSCTGPSPAHLSLARLLAYNCCHTLSLNFDPLLQYGMAELRQITHELLSDDSEANFHLISLHSASDIRSYYSSMSRTFQPAATHARGDVFYARCTNQLCPDNGKDRPLDYSRKYRSTGFRCPSCHLYTARLQLSFPGYERKEKLLEPILRELRLFIGSRTSLIITIGLSGRWDPYLLTQLFDWTLDNATPLVDVKIPDHVNSFDRFRQRYYPSIHDAPSAFTASYLNLGIPADEFLNWFAMNSENLGLASLAPQLQGRNS